MQFEEVIIVRFGELYLKGKNRYVFENALINNIRQVLKNFNVKVEKILGRVIVSGIGQDKDTILSKVSKVFGISSLSIAAKMPTSEQNIQEFCKNIATNLKGTFKVEVKRADKTFPIHSNDLEKQLGSLMLHSNKELSVDIHNPQTYIDVDIRDNKQTYISYQKLKGLGGMPLGTSGSALLLLSGGIDSPVAGFLMGKRGLTINAIYFHSHPHTSEKARQKVRDLAKVIASYTGKLKLFEVPFTQIQEQIKFECDDRFTIAVMRRQMYKIAEIIALKHGFNALITGENLAQVASQTVQGITCSNAILKSLPMFRPLISFDKLDTIEISKKIGAYDISILPYEDCCTVFVPKNPIIKPTVDKCLFEEDKIVNLDILIDTAVQNTEIVEFDYE